MRVDVVTIFPDYFTPLELSLVGKARTSGLLDVRVHDLRRWTHDRHRTVDDTPYGGGAGMVMKPEPWGEALDAIVPDRPGPGTVLVVPTPAGERFTQQHAADLATREHLVVACGRYEGIDQRVLEHASDRMEVHELSLGDYVLNGGEVAALAIIESVVRLIPGFVGNPESLTEESHAGGLLEYPLYTKPAEWRGLTVPEVLLSGDHARIAAWRHDQSVRRTAARRPDLAHRSAAVDVAGIEGEIGLAVPADAAELLVLQRACWLEEQQVNPGVHIDVLHESLEDVRAWLAEWTTLVLRVQGRLVGAVRGRRQGELWDLGRLMVAPDLRGRGLGRLLLEAIERAAPPETTGYVLFTGAGSKRNLRRYQKAGYRVQRDPGGAPGTVRLTKPRTG